MTGLSASASSNSVGLKLGCTLKTPGVLFKSWCQGQTPAPAPPPPAKSESLGADPGNRKLPDWLSCAVNVEHPLLVIPAAQTPQWLPDVTQFSTKSRMLNSHPHLGPLLLRMSVEFISSGNLLEMRAQAPSLLIKKPWSSGPVGL